ncbi:MAG: PEP-CTERM sorting domain-containing protein [Thiobacillus sp.]
MYTHRILFPATLLAVSLSTPASAAVIVDWDLTSMDGDEITWNANSAAVGITGNALIEGATLTPSLGGGSMNAKGWTGEATDYFSFGFTVASGYSVDLASLVIGSKSSGTGPGSMGLYYSGDNFASVLYTFSETGTESNNNVNLVALNHLTGSVEFRVAQIGTIAANGGATSSTGTFRIAEYFDGAATTNLQFNGSVAAVPEADTYAMMLAGLGLVGLMARRRRA